MKEGAGEKDGLSATSGRVFSIFSEGGNGGAAVGKLVVFGPDGNHCNDGPLATLLSAHYSITPTASLMRLIDSDNVTVLDKYSTDTGYDNYLTHSLHNHGKWSSDKN